MKKRLSISEMLKAVAEAPKDKRVELLQQFASERTTLLTAIQLAVDPRVQWRFAREWVPQYAPCVELDQWARLHQEMRKMDKFLVGGPSGNVPEERLRQLFTQLLEALDPPDAEFLVLALQRKLPYKLNRKLIDEAFPGFLAEEAKVG